MELLLGLALAHKGMTIAAAVAIGLIVGITLAEMANTKVGAIGTMNNAMVDPNIMASPAGVITPTYVITRVSGTNAITGITVPFNGFHGRITFIPTGIFTWTTATNIGLAGTAVVGKALDFTYDPYSAKWYPSYIA